MNANFTRNELLVILEAVVDAGDYVCHTLRQNREAGSSLYTETEEQALHIYAHSLLQVSQKILKAIAEGVERDEYRITH